MKATAFEFRVRIFIIALIYTLGFFSPWEKFFGSGVRTNMWLDLSSGIAATRWLSLSEATLFVTVCALFLGMVGTALRVWSTAYLGGETVTDSSMVAAGIVASGPYRHVRNPLYLGTWLVSFPIGLLMPISGAIFVLVATLVFELRLIAGEEAFLTGKLGPIYEDYKRRVPRLVPKILSAIGSADVRPRWVQAIFAEVFPVGFMLCFAVLAWRYNTQLLTKCLLVCFGASLIVKALIQREK
jgi:protein-S-isoprenylcysteine O-methyltransferase Ste14